MPLASNRVAEQVWKHKGKLAMWGGAGTAVLVLAGVLSSLYDDVMGVVTPHLEAQTRWLAVQEVGQAAAYPLVLYPSYRVAAEGVVVEFRAPTINPSGWYAQSATLRLQSQAGPSGGAVSVPQPMVGTVSVLLPSVPAGTYYLVLELVLTNGTDFKNFTLNAKHNWEVR